MAATHHRHVEGLPAPDRCLVMGVLNVTPDSFSDGGLFLDAEQAVAHGRHLAADGADLVDVGGESTRPGAVRCTEAQERERVLPVIEQLAAEGVLVSVDTMRAGVAEAAVRSGAVLVNDVSGGRADPDMLATVAGLGTPYVLMHWRGHADTMQQHTTYEDVASDVARELRAQLESAVAAGIEPARIALDPGIGFAKTGDQNWEVLGRLDVVGDLGLPLLVATSRKGFLGRLLASGDEPRPAAGRDDATTATVALAADRGAWCVRAHAVRAAADAVRVAARWRAAEHPR